MLDFHAADIRMIHWWLQEERPAKIAPMHQKSPISCVDNSCNEKSAQRDANTARALAVVRFGHRPPAVTNPQTEPITIHCTAAS